MGNIRIIDDLDGPRAVGAAVRHARRGITQSELARRSGLNQSKVSKVERGQMHASVGLFVHLLRQAGVGTLEVHFPSGSVLVDGEPVRWPTE